MGVHCAQFGCINMLLLGKSNVEICIFFFFFFENRENVFVCENGSRKLNQYEANQ